jgi:conjugal transfer pilus assembly protein TraB
MGPSIRDRASTLIERMSPRARQWATIGAISAVAVGVLWTVFAMGSGDSPQRSAVAAGAGDLKPTNVDLMAPGAQVREVEAWVGQAGKKLAQYESERDDQRRINRERKEAEDNLMRHLPPRELHARGPARRPGCADRRPVAVQPAPGPDPPVGQLGAAQPLPRPSTASASSSPPATATSAPSAPTCAPRTCPACAPTARRWK